MSRAVDEARRRIARCRRRGRPASTSRTDEGGHGVVAGGVDDCVELIGIPGGEVVEVARCAARRAIGPARASPRAGRRRAPRHPPRARTGRRAGRSCRSRAPARLWPGSIFAARTARRRVASRLDERGRSDADVLGDLVGEPRRNEHLLGERSRPVAADADLVAVRADVVVAGAAVFASAATEHRVAGDALAEPRLVGGIADCDYAPGPLVAEAQREARVALLDVRHLAGVELDVGAADADPFDVDEQLSGSRDRIRHLLDRRLARRRDDERAHQPASLQYGVVVLPGHRVTRQSGRA